MRRSAWIPAPPEESEPAIVSATGTSYLALLMRDVLKLVRDLQRRKARERRSLVILEGWRLVEDAMGGGAKIVGLLAASDAEADASGASDA